MRQGERAALAGRTTESCVADNERDLIERFQEEHPGFDFRSAEFNGQVPDPRAFMGGVKYT